MCVIKKIGFVFKRSEENKLLNNLRLGIKKSFEIGLVK